MSERVYTTGEKRLIDSIKTNLPHVCYYCNKMLTDKDVVTVDHKIPVSRGGLTTKENLVLACVDCNNEKDNMTENEYYEYKNRQDKLLNNFEYNSVLNDLLNAQTNIINKVESIKNEMLQVENKIKYIQEEMMYNNFNACDGYLYAKELKELLNRKSELSLSKEQYKQLKDMMQNHFEQTKTMTTKIIKQTTDYHKPVIKKQVMNKTTTVVKKKKTNVIELKSVAN
jgi:hypothetical protein